MPLNLFPRVFSGGAVILPPGSSFRCLTSVLSLGMADGLISYKGADRSAVGQFLFFFRSLRVDLYGLAGPFP